MFCSVQTLVDLPVQVYSITSNIYNRKIVFIILAVVGSVLTINRGMHQCVFDTTWIIWSIVSDAT